jgi:curved DNA-binding protein CbpA
LAHETLSNPTLRQRYDDRSDFSSSDESDFEDDLDSEDLSYKDINDYLRRTFGFGRVKNYEE